MQLAENTLQSYWDGFLPVDVKSIAESMGIGVEADASLGEASGYYSRGLQGKRPLIRYNPHEAPVRQRFTIAHELGHHLQGDDFAPRDTASQMFSYEPIHNKKGVYRDA